MPSHGGNTTTTRKRSLQRRPAECGSGRGAQQHRRDGDAKGSWIADEGSLQVVVVELVAGGPNAIPSDQGITIRK